MALWQLPTGLVHVRTYVRMGRYTETYAMSNSYRIPFPLSYNLQLLSMPTDTKFTGL